MPRKPPRVSTPAEFVIGDDVDLADEVVFDVDGRRVDQSYVDDLVETVHRRPGRPGLSTAAGRSPAVSFRLPTDIREQAERVAAAAGISVSRLAREALQHRLGTDPSISAAVQQAIDSLAKTPASDAVAAQARHMLASMSATPKEVTAAVAQMTASMDALLAERMREQLEQFRAEFTAEVLRSPQLEASVMQFAQNIAGPSSD